MKRFGPRKGSKTARNRGERPAGAPSDDEIERMIEESEGLSFSRLNPRRGNDARKAANFKKARGFLVDLWMLIPEFPIFKGGI